MESLTYLGKSGTNAFCRHFISMVMIKCLHYQIIFVGKIMHELISEEIDCKKDLDQMH